MAKLEPTPEQIQAIGNELIGETSDLITDPVTIASARRMFALIAPMVLEEIAQEAGAAWQPDVSQFAERVRAMKP